MRDGGVCLLFFSGNAIFRASILGRPITLGNLTLYVVAFRQGQQAFQSVLASIGSIYEQNLYMSNLFEFLDAPRGTTANAVPMGTAIAKGASVNHDETTKVDAKIGLTVPESVADVKPLFQFIQNRTQGIAFNSKTDFILAFRVQRIIFVGGKARNQLSTKGTSMMDGGDKARELPQAKLEGDLSLDNAKEEAEKEEVAVMAAKDDDGDDFEWIVSNGKFE